jgi:hypothetical protein
VFVNRGEGGQLQPVGQFFVTRAVPVLLDKVRDEVEDLFLPFGESHGLIVGEEKEKVK